MSIPTPDFVAGTTIVSSQVDANNADIVTELTNSIAADGQTTITANIPMNSKKLTGLPVGSAATDSLHLGQAQAEAYIWCGTAGGTKNALTLSPAPAITAYAAGQRFRFTSGATQSDDAVTFAVSGLTTKAGQFDGAALSATIYIEASKIYEAYYDGTQFQLQRLFKNELTYYRVGGTDVAVADGGTGSSTAAGARTNLSAAASGANSDITSLSGLTTPLSVAQGGTGSATLGDAGVLIGNGTGAVQVTGAGTAGQVFTSNGAGVDPTFQAAAASGFTLGTLQATTSGTTKDFTGIPAGTKLIFISLQGVSLGGNSALLIQIGDAGGFEASGYLSTSNSPAQPVTTSSTAGFIVDVGPGAAAIVSGVMILSLMDAATFLWSESHATKLSATVASHGGGDKALSAELTQVRITSVAADTFDAGSVNIMYIG